MRSIPQNHPQHRKSNHIQQKCRHQHQHRPFHPPPQNSTSSGSKLPSNFHNPYHPGPKSANTLSPLHASSLLFNRTNSSTASSRVTASCSRLADNCPPCSTETKYNSRNRRFAFTII